MCDFYLFSFVSEDTFSIGKKLSDRQI